MNRLVPVLVLSSCNLIPVNCTEIGCGSGLSLTLTAATGTLALGVYEVTTDGDACQFTVAGPDDCNGDDRCILASTCMLSEEGDGTVTVLLTPRDIEEEIALTVTIDGVALIEENVLPDYEEFQPNGPNCEPTCYQANLDYAL